MRCQHCAYDNPAGSAFCQQCGVRLSTSTSSSDLASGVAARPVGLGAGAGHSSTGDAQVLGGAGLSADMRACGRCGTPNPPHMRFCTECGLPLAAEPEPAQSRAPMGPTPVSGLVPSLGRRAVAEDPGTATNGAEAAAFSTANAGASESATPGASPSAAHKNTMLQSFPAAEAKTAEARLISILKDGSDGQVYPVALGQIDVGRSEGDVVLAEDPYLSPRHARILRRGESFVLRDLDSVNGIYVRIREPVELTDGTMILLGQQVLRFEILPDGELPLGPATLRGVLVFGTPEAMRIARLVQYTTEGVGRDLHYLHRDETVLGRENGDIVFTDDPFLSRRHAAIVMDRGARRFTLRDLGSSNGTAIALRGERTLQHDDHFRIGRHLFRFEMRGTRSGG